MKPYIQLLIFVAMLIETYSLLPLNHPPAATQAGNDGPIYRAGIIHVHSVFSDGGGTVSEIVDAGRGAGMDFVILTDHNNSRARKEGQEKNYDGVDLFVEMEASTQAGHAITFYSHTTAREMTDAEVNKLSWSHFLGQETRPEMFLALAHPSNRKNPWNRLDRYAEGIEVINFDSAWQREVSESIPDFLLTMALYPLNNFLSALRFFQIYRKDFVAWDTMNSISRGHFGILAHDTHEKVILKQDWALRWPTYRETFKLASNVLFFDAAPPVDFESRKKLFYDSIRRGRSAMIFQLLFPFSGNDWRLDCEKMKYRSGDDVPESRGACEFVVNTPSGFPYAHVVRLYKDGEINAESSNPGPIRFPLKGAGVYRVEVWAKPVTQFRVFLNREVPYLFYNPIYVR